MTEQKENNKKQVHIILQGKGGVGKSVVASLLAQYLKKQKGLCCVDTDPINPTFSKFKSLEVEHLNLLSSPNRINERIFDTLIEKILTVNKNFIIDNGAGGFLAISNYILENDIINVLAEHDVYIHIPITGGQAFKETVKGLLSIVNQFDQKAKIVLWINEYFGKLDQDIESYPFYKEIHDRISAKLIIPEQSIDTFGADIKRMFTDHKTFDEIGLDENLKFMVKRRLNIFKEQIFIQLEDVKI